MLFFSELSLKALLAVIRCALNVISTKIGWCTLKMSEPPNVSIASQVRWHITLLRLIEQNLLLIIFVQR